MRQVRQQGKRETGAKRGRPGGCTVRVGSKATTEAGVVKPYVRPHRGSNSWKAPLLSGMGESEAKTFVRKQVRQEARKAQQQREGGHAS